MVVMSILATLGVIFSIILILGAIWGTIHFVDNYKVLWELLDHHATRIQELTDQLQVLNDTMLRWKTQRGN